MMEGRAARILGAGPNVTQHHWLPNSAALPHDRALQSLPHGGMHDLSCLKVGCIVIIALPQPIRVMYTRVHTPKTGKHSCLLTIFVSTATRRPLDTPGKVMGSWMKRMRG